MTNSHLIEQLAWYHAYHRSFGFVHHFLRLFSFRNVHCYNIQHVQVTNVQLHMHMSFAYTYRNKLIHIIFVPTILISSFALASFIPLLSYPLFDVGTSYNHDYFPINNILFFSFSFMYPVTYLFLDIKYGISWLPVGCIIWYLSNYASQSDLLDFQTQEFKSNRITNLTLILLLSWIFQFIGHGAFEQRRPSLVDSLYASFVLAPLFVWFETVIFPLGFAQHDKVKCK